MIVLIFDLDDTILMSNTYSKYEDIKPDEYMKYILDGINCKKVPEIGVSWKEDGSVSPKRTLLNLPKNIIIFIIHIVMEFISINRFKPDIIISDSRLSSIIISRIMRIKSMTILNQIRFID